jgi:ABC-type glycerol-3-phosphate transport system substrate-binding protein
MKKSFALALVVILVAATVAACAPEPEVVVETVEVEKVVTQEVEKVVTEVVEVEKEVEKVVTEVVEVEKEVEKIVEVTAEPTEKTVVEFWSTDHEEERVDMYEEIAARFMEENPDIDLRILVIMEAEVSQRMATALAANRPPDLIRMGV